MKPVVVDRGAEIKKGKLKGEYGWVTGFDSNEDKVQIELDEMTTVVTSSENIQQEINYINRTCSCGTIYSIKETHNDGNNLCHHCGENF
ncbi:hypothetical protein PP175_27825 (plasmid) [Aneurinibacillus sp. Ricciae_BoGa-3]|uniref:hypothetical protein n=1 Tax=Aneurinibacillus sp. Ricciae_BoGa-3 TaxID=3022697 RepID=UPI002340452A|nr:hypothetical protein [Aneurinibacillus sp. Ricciae_BoGa-3]WCK57002.1 hypothetical protein PP175_27825 [Aneurinibacillus sp. Ricciae_BoGa-3]